MPRRPYSQVGLTGAQEHHTDQASEDGRLLGMTDTIEVLREGRESDGAGDYKAGTGLQVVDTVIGRLDSAGVNDDYVQGDQVHEDAKSIATVPVGTNIKTSDKLRIGGNIYSILALHKPTDAIVWRADLA